MQTSELLLLGLRAADFSSTSISFVAFILVTNLEKEKQLY